ncbi:hypothetical protein R6Q59_004783 [Mikania micrantha]
MSRNRSSGRLLVDCKFVMHANRPSIPHHRRNKVDPPIPPEKLTTDRNHLPDFDFIMEVEYMKACVRKLAIWYTPNFKPIITHDELDHIMSTLGFLPLPPISTTATVGWKEYLFSAAGAFLSKSPSPPRPRLPYPRIDGLHLNTYHSFVKSVNFYLQMNEISDLFHIRGVPLHHAHDRGQKWLRMIGDDLVYVYREGTMDMSATYKNGNKDKNPDLIIVPWKSIMDRIL